MENKPRHDDNGCLVVGPDDDLSGLPEDAVHDLVVKRVLQQGQSAVKTLRAAGIDPGSLEGLRGRHESLKSAGPQAASNGLADRAKGVRDERKRIRACLDDAPVPPPPLPR